MTKRLILTTLIAIAILAGCSSTSSNNKQDDPAVKPKITTQPVSAEYVHGAVIAPLRVAATVDDGGTLSYQWYKNSTRRAVDDDSKKIPGAVSDTYTPDMSDNDEMWYYYAAITNTKAGTSATTFSLPMEVSIITVSPKPNPNLPANLPDTGKFRFGVISDVHIGGSGGDHSTDLYPNIERLNKALDWYNRQNVSALAIVGDITDHASPEEWKAFKNSWDEHGGNLGLIAVMGNHDAEARNAGDRFENYTGEKTNAHYLLGGYHFIVITGGSGALTGDSEKADGVLASGRTALSGASSSDDATPQSVKDWLRKQVDDAKKDAPGKPIFVFHHWPVQNTFYVSDEWYTPGLGDNSSNYFFKDDPEVIVFGGHSHSTNSDPRSIWQGGFTAVNTVTLYYYKLDHGYLGISSDGIEDDTYPKPAAGAVNGDAVSQGLVVSVEGSKVTIENYDFAVTLGPDAPVEKIAQTWVFDVLNPASFPYTPAKRETQKIAPVFAANAAIRVKAITDTSVTVEFDQAAIPRPNPGSDEVHSYRFEFINKATGQTELTRKQWSDFMVLPSLRKPVYEQLLGGLTSGASYELRIYAISSFQAESAKYLKTEFTTK